MVQQRGHFGPGLILDQAAVAAAEVHVGVVALGRAIDEGTGLELRGVLTHAGQSYHGASTDAIKAMQNADPKVHDLAEEILGDWEDEE